MPWNDIDSGAYKDILSKTTELIKLRSREPLCSSADMRFICRDDMPRVVHIIKGCPESDERLEIIINAGDTDFISDENADIIYSNLFSGNVLHPDGTIILKKH